MAGRSDSRLIRRALLETDHPTSNHLNDESNFLATRSEHLMQRIMDSWALRTAILQSR